MMTESGAGLSSAVPGVPPSGPLGFQFDFKFHADAAASGLTTVSE